MPQLMLIYHNQVLQIFFVIVLYLEIYFQVRNFL